MWALRMRQEVVNRQHGLSAFTDRPADTLDRPRPDVAHRKHARDRRFKLRGRGAPTGGWPTAGNHEARLVQCDSATLQPFCGRIRANEEKDIADRGLGLSAGAMVTPPDLLEASSSRAGQGDDFRLRHQLDI